MWLAILEHIRWIIEAKVLLASEINDLFVKRFLGLERSSYSKKRRTKRMRVCHKYTRWTCNTCYQSYGYLSINREDKIKYIQDKLNKESLNNILETLKIYPYGMV